MEVVVGKPRNRATGGVNKKTPGAGRSNVALGVVLVACVGVVTWAVSRGDPARAPAPVPSPAAGDSGAALVRKHCTVCHLEPPPSAFPRQNWVFALNIMGQYVGYDENSFRANFDQEEWRRIVDHRLLPTAPVMSFERWRRIRQHFHDTAPVGPLAIPARPAPGATPLFRAERAAYQPEMGFTISVRVDEKAREAYLGDALVEQVVVINDRGQVARTLKVPGGPVDVEVRRDDVVITLVGSFPPSNERLGGIVSLPRTGPPTPTPLAKGIFRVTDSALADLDGDGTPEIVSSQYGHHVGHLSIFRQRGAAWEETPVLVQQGATTSEVKDFTGDGLPDVMTVFAQARESLHLFVNQGNLTFQDRVLLSFMPAWGSVYFETADFNGDGLLDVLFVNGDNGDQPLPPVRDYHGVRLYLNQGDFKLREAFSYPMHGAYKAIPRDFDGDGDLDIACISFFPDLSSPDPEWFTLLRNDGDQRFTPQRVEGLPAGRWIAMDAGDLDGDGDVDLVLGAAYSQVGFVDMADWNRLAQEGPAAVILRNTRVDRR
jgi:hypothetical protein